MKVTLSKKASKNTESSNEILVRLQNENAQWRRKVELVEILLRQTSSSLAGLSLKGAVETIIIDRNNCLDRIEFYREELSLILQLLLADKTDEAKKELNAFLYKNPK